MGLKGTEEVGAEIYASDAGMAAFNGRNTQAEHIVWAACMVLRVLIGPLTMQKEVGDFFYLLHSLLGT